MTDQQQLAYRMANKVALNMRYVDSTGDPVAVDGMIRDAFAVVENFLDHMDPIELKSFCETFDSNYRAQVDTLRDNAVNSAAFVAAECDRMHDTGIQEKTIAEIGTRLSLWDRQPVEFTGIGSALDGVCELFSNRRDRLALSMRRDPVYAGRAKKFTTAFSSLACGLALICDAIGRTKSKDGQPGLHESAIAAFGGNLICTSYALLAAECAKVPSDESE